MCSTRRMWSSQRRRTRRQRTGGASLSIRLGGGDTPHPDVPVPDHPRTAVTASDVSRENTPPRSDPLEGNRWPHSRLVRRPRIPTAQSRRLTPIGRRSLLPRLPGLPDLRRSGSSFGHRRPVLKDLSKDNPHKPPPHVFASDRSFSTLRERSPPATLGAAGRSSPARHTSTSARKTWAITASMISFPPRSRLRLDFLNCAASHRCWCSLRALGLEDDASFRLR